jgi:RNA polymerase sigma factor (sigma-70 family)
MAAMSSPPNHGNEEVLPVQRCQRGDPEALAQLREACQDGLRKVLLARGATLTETEDLLADLWADCVPGADDRPSLLEKFSGKCAVQAWLATVLTRRWIDLKRKQVRRGEVDHATFGDPKVDVMQRLPAPAVVETENALVVLLRDSLRAAIAGCPPHVMVLLRLRYLHNLTQRELARMLGWHEAKMSRTLSGALDQIQAAVLGEVRSRDPWLQLTWQDFLDLCESQDIGFL